MRRQLAQPQPGIGFALRALLVERRHIELQPVIRNVSDGRVDRRLRNLATNEFELCMLVSPLSKNNS